MLKIDLTQPTSEFVQHLALEDNSRIIFSGIFGIGKTHFLNSFFQEKKEEFLAVHLFPVNYSVSKNEDIFELIKTDIIYEILLNPSFKGEKIKFDDDLLLSFYLANNALDVVGKFVEFVPEIGKTVSQIIEKSSSLIKKFKEFKKGMLLDDQKELLNYSKSRGNEKGSIYESDFYTQLIVKSLNQIASEGNKPRKKILIIDDLDRIDPEHIFRLLNIFSAHFDVKEEDENKFGFDKIVFVCDIDNIRNIYSSKYGSNVDFNGYLDKFYSREIFHFNNEKAIRSIINNILKSVKYASEALKASIERNPLVEDLLTLMVLSNSINLRALLKLKDKPFNIENREIPFKGGKAKVSIEYLEVAIVFTFLNKVFGNADALSKAVEKSVNFKNEIGCKLISEGFKREVMEQLLIVVDCKNHSFHSSHSSYTFLYRRDEDNDHSPFVTIFYNLERRGYNYFVNIESANYPVGPNNKPKEVNDFDGIRWVVEVTKILINLGILK